MPDDPAISRRSVLQGAVGLCAVAALAAGEALLADTATASDTTTAADGITRLPDGRVRVVPARIPALATIGGGVLLGTVKGRPVALVRTGSASYVALDLRCTHQGTTVRRKGAGWKCPAHGSRYTASGAVTRDPATQDLARVRVTRSGRALIVG